MTRISDTGTPILADYIHEPDLAEEMKVTLRTWRSWKGMGETPTATRIGKKTYYHRDDIAAWLRAQRVEVA